MLSSKTKKEEKELRSADLNIHQCKEESDPKYSDRRDTGYSYSIMNKRKGEIALTSVWDYKLVNPKDYQINNR
jgi:hypothetical protein